MIPSMEPFTRWTNLATGEMAGTELVERRLSDMRAYYADPAGPGNGYGGDGIDPLIYRVFAMPVVATNSELQCSTTILEPGQVGAEYYMTKGHFHAKRDRAEVYFALKGTGVLLMATESGRYWTEPLGPGSVSYVPGGWAHRSVNIGSEPLVLFAVYVGDAGHDYQTVAKMGLPVMITADGDGYAVRPNRRYRPGGSRPPKVGRE